MSSDRTIFKQVETGALGSNRSVQNAALCIAQDAQRFVEVSIGAAATTATSDYNLPAGRFDRPVTVKEFRILPGGALTFTTGNYVTLTLGYTNDNSATIANTATLTTITTSNTAANGATGNWAFGTSINVALNSPNVNMTVPAGSQLVVTSVHTGGAGVAIPGGTRFQILVEEV